jgi:ADP-ribosylglycohydrolase
VELERARDRIRGSLLAGAVGDALGAPVEFMLLAEIRERHGPAGVSGYLPAYGRSGGAIADDTQMTLFTADGMIRSLVRFSHRGIVDPPSVMRRSYWRWLTTQGEPWPPSTYTSDGPNGWLLGVEELHARRSPGNTCISALASGAQGTVENPINGSKGCGGVMRVAPTGLTNATPEPFGLAAACVAITHGHPSGYLSAGFLGSLIASLFAGATLDEGLDAACARLREHDGHEETLAAVAAARALAGAGDPTPERVESLGAGWVGDEALAIAVYCSLAASDLRSALLLAVNHSGDSDSTASITGNILGAMHGESALPADWLEGLELRGVIASVADDLADAFYGAGVGSEYEPYDARVEEWLVRYPGNRLGWPMPNARSALVEAGHLVNPAHPAVISYLEPQMGTHARSLTRADAPGP